jgi:hypothetical protein
MSYAALQSIVGGREELDKYNINNESIDHKSEDEQAPSNLIMHKIN